MKKWGLFFYPLAAAMALWVLYAPVSRDILRLHVLANSDSALDQTIKLRVRDALQEEFASRWQSLTDGKEAYAMATAEKEAMTACANRVLQEAGAPYQATVTVGLEDYPAKSYEDAVLLPAGRYYGVRVLLGEAEGQNWFCMLYPPLCTPNTDKTGAKSWIFEKMPQSWQKTLRRFWKGKQG